MTTLVDITPILAKLLRLLGSDKPGEVVASVNALRRVLGSAELDFHDLAAVIELAAHRGALRMAPMPRGNDNPLDMLRLCFRNANGLSMKELKIVRSIADWCREPSRHHMTLLRPIYRKCLEMEMRKERRS